MAELNDPKADHISGRLADLKKSDLKKLQATTPESDHWLLTGFPIGRKASGGRDINITLPGVIGVAAVPAILVGWGFWDNPFLWPIALLLGWVVSLVADGILDSVLPSSAGLAAARDTLKSAKKGDAAALAQTVTVEVQAGERVCFGLPQLGASWEPRGDSDDRKEAAALAVRMRQAFSAIGTSRAEAALTASTNDTPASAPQSQDHWATTLLSYESAVRERAGAASDDVIAAMRELTVFAALRPEHDDETQRTVTMMRQDALQAVEVYTKLDATSGALQLPSGLTPTQELQETLTLVCGAARTVHEKGQLNQADELSYLRRVNEMRYRRSDLDLD